LKDATSISLVGLKLCPVELELDAPTLGEAAPEAFEQLPLWDVRPHREQSALSLVEDAVRDAVEGNQESDLLDRSILGSVAILGKVLDEGYFRIVFTESERAGPEVEVTREGLQTAERLRKEAPPPQRVIVTGWLDSLTGSKRAFQLKLSSGQTLRGILPPGDPGAYAPFFTKKVMVDGEARFRPSGAVSLIIASHIQPATPADEIWERVPRPRPRSLEEVKPRTPVPKGANVMDRIWGRWPGDETTEELLAALRKIG
jgi:hypothetical protein